MKKSTIAKYLYSVDYFRLKRHWRKCFEIIHGFWKIPIYVAFDLRGNAPSEPDISYVQPQQRLHSNI